MNFLIENHYNVLSIPREDIAPLSVVTPPNGTPTLLGPLSGMMAPDSDPQPEPKVGPPGINIVGRQRAAIEAKGGFSILSGLLKLFGVQAAPKVEAAYSKASNFSFYFQSVQNCSLTAVDVNNYLGRTRPGELEFIQEMFDQKGEAVLISETLASNKFGVVAEGTDTAAVSAAVELANMAEGKIKVTVDNAIENMVWYEGTNYLTFAFKGYLIWLNTNIDPHKFQLAFMRKVAPSMSAAKDTEAKIIRAEQEHGVIYERNGLLEMRSRS